MSTPLEHLEHESSVFMPSCVLAAMAELDLATVLLSLGNAATAEQLASHLDCDYRGMEMLLDALVALGYFSKSGIGAQALFSVVEDYAPWLNSKEPASYIPMLRHRADILRHWSRLSWAVREGKAQTGNTESFLGRAQDKVSFITAMNAIALQLTAATIEALDGVDFFEKIPAEARILDIGGASGTYTEAFLQRLPHAKATLFDLPAGITEAKKRFLGSALESRVTLLEGDFTQRGFPQDHDFAWISAIIHQFGREESRSLYRKALAALRPGGLVAIRDFVMEEHKTAPKAGALFGINMLVETPQGRVYSFEEIREDLVSVGFEDVEYLVREPTMSAIVTAKRPEHKNK